MWRKSIPNAGVRSDDTAGAADGRVRLFLCTG